MPSGGRERGGHPQARSGGGAAASRACRRAIRWERGTGLDRHLDGDGDGGDAGVGELDKFAVAAGVLAVGAAGCRVLGEAGGGNGGIRAGGEIVVVAGVGADGVVCIGSRYVGQRVEPAGRTAVRGKRG